MGSLGIRGTGSGIVPILQKAWVAAVENAAEQHDDKLDVLRDVAVGVETAAGAALARFDVVARRVFVLAVVAAVALVACAVFAGGIAVMSLMELCRLPGAEVIR